MKKTAFVCLLLLVAFASARRLPDTVVPEHYDLTFTPDLPTATFRGEERIDVRLLQPASAITLHAVDIEFDEVTVTAAGARQKAEVALDPKAETATLKLAQPLPAGPASIHVRYRGKLSDNLRGFYLSQTKQRRYAVTQMEPTDARRAFPSFDEPAFKATYDVTIVADKGDVAFSNMAQVSDTPGPGDAKHTVKFARTPKMSTYLVAMAVGDFQCISGAAGDIPIRVCATPGKQELGRFGLAAAEESLRFFNRYYGIKYPFGKLDVIAFPDFSAGAMENAGLITYRETLLLIDENRASTNTKRFVAEVMAHEIAHMWFGDLVTMKWWDDIWLNEGFASWAATKPVAAWKPEFNVAQGEAADNVKAMASDSLQAARPIRSQAASTAQISQLFDAMSYEKSAAVLRMVENYLGEEVFRKAVNTYLKEHAYGNASSEDFWNTLARVSGKPVDRVMRSFVEQPGVPLVSVEARCLADTTVIKLRQERFSYGGSHAKESKQLWDMPVCFKSPGAATQCELLAAKQQTVKLDGCRPWVYANAGNRGYYRAAYDPATLRRLAAAPELTPVERYNLVEDTWALVRSGHLGVTDLLVLAESLKDNRERAVISAIAGHLEYVSDTLVTDADRESYALWVRRLLRPIADELGFTPAASDDPERKVMRSYVLHALGTAGRDPAVIRFATQFTEEAISRSGAVEPTLFGNMVDVAAVNGDRELYEKLLDQTKDTSLPPNVYYTYLYALTAFRDPALIQRTLELLLSPAVRNQDAAILLDNILANPTAQPVAWTFVKTRWNTLKDKLATYSYGDVAGYVGSFCDAGLRDDAQAFFSQNAPEAGALLTRAVEKVNNCIALRSSQSSRLAAWLKSGSSSGQQ